MKIQDKYIPIKQWSLQDRPREKLKTSGCKNLTDAELLAIVIGTGTQKESALGLANRILAGIQFDLKELGKLSVRDLMQYKGVGMAKAIAIIAALELGSRREHASRRKRDQITKSIDAYRMIANELGDLQTEEFWILLLNRNNRVVSKHRISQGGVAGTIVDPKLVFQLALEKLASSIILAHNHPSGNLLPSKADKRLTEKLVKAGQFMDIQILDHLIIGDDGFLSFADEGLL